tara:strand:- start:346 stop:525 length:180 start_codon:yes stop_codon:yes gene_type:complete
VNEKIGCYCDSSYSWIKNTKELIDSAFQAYLKDPINTIYSIGSVVGQYPFPMMVRDFSK